MPAAFRFLISWRRSCTLGCFDFRVFWFRFGMGAFAFGVPLPGATDHSIVLQSPERGRRRAINASAPPIQNSHRPQTTLLNGVTFIRSPPM